MKSTARNEQCELPSSVHVTVLEFAYLVSHSRGASCQSDALGFDDLKKGVGSRIGTLVFSPMEGSLD